MKNKTEQVEPDEIYRTLPLQNIPWNIETPPDALVQLVQGGRIKPCKVIDFGCGAGNYAIYLASKGFDVTGVDISPRAIEFAKENAGRKNVKCHFIVADVLGDVGKNVNETFDFAYDWELLHHIYPENREKYVRNVHKVLAAGGKYFSVCFSEKDTEFGGSGKYRKTRLGTILYFSSEKELRDLFSRFFNIIELTTIEISGTTVSHFVNCAFMTKKEPEGD